MSNNYHKFTTLLVTLSLILILGTACISGGESAAPEDNLDGTQWILTAMGPESNPTTPLPDAPIDLAFKDARVLGTGGCNRYFADYTLAAKDKITIGLPGVTMMACRQEIMDHESQYLAALQNATSYTLTQDTLRIFYPDGVLQFAAFVEPADLPLEGTVWQLTTFVTADTARSLLNGTEITATFAQGQVNGSAGCNRYFADYETNGETITFSPPGSTRMACAPEIMDQENEFLATMQAVTSFQIVGEQITLSGEMGTLIFHGTPVDESAP
ncbi:MAG: META domain-containing protein [Anaerolineales bacterium]|nr:META domain-containing protein [Anaerolineales bacterium]MCB8951478.1 META domain-containing protein [Ardenticatenales bacterium]